MPCFLADNLHSKSSFLIRCLFVLSTTFFVPTDSFGYIFYPVCSWCVLRLDQYTNEYCSCSHSTMIPTFHNQPIYDQFPNKLEEYYSQSNYLSSITECRHKGRHNWIILLYRYRHSNLFYFYRCQKD